MKTHTRVIRNPIIQRFPIIQRVPIFHRKPCCSGVQWAKCRLCSHSEDCAGNKFVSPENTESVGLYRLIYIASDFDDWDNLEQSIWSLSNQGVLLRLITDKEMPKEIIWAASYSEKNVVQLNLNMMQFKHEITWIEKLMSIANKCGVYCVLCINPIVPGVTRTYHVIDILDRLQKKGYFHVNLKFCEIPDSIISCDNWMNFNGYLLPARYMKHTQSGWECSSEFKQKFMSKIQLFTVPLKISISACGEHDCTG